MWVVLQVETGQEQGVQQALQAMENMVALVPRENRAVRKGGAWTQKEYILFPGYVFLSLDYNADNYYKVRAVPHVLRFLGTSGLAPSRLSYLEAEWIKVLSGGGKPWSLPKYAGSRTAPSRWWAGCWGILPAALSNMTAMPAGPRWS